jgi:hypothetical protein
MSFDAARAIFNTVDVNHDGTIDRNEFNQWVSSAALGSGSGSSIYESSAYGSGGYGVEGSASAYELSSASAAGAQSAGFSYASSGNLAYGAGASYGSQAAASAYATDAQGLYQDPNPQIIRRPAIGGVQTYTQNVKVRFLQPPPVPPPGPLIIREVRPPQPPVPPPLRIRQQAPAYPIPPPLVLRERPPIAPAPIPSQTVIRRLAALPVPPRSVIIERLPPLPPRPRDVIIERWIPYGQQPKRRTIVQRAPPAKPYPHPRNIIIQYEPTAARVVRQIHRLGVTAANPAAYVQQYGHQLLDSVTLLQQARAAGVIEDISPPAAVGYSVATYGQDASALGGSSWAADGCFGWGGSTQEGGFASASSFESTLVDAAGVDIAGAAFRAVDTNNDGFIDRSEFNRFFQQGL